VTASSNSTVELILKDSEGGESTYSFEIQIDYVEPEAEEEEEEDEDSSSPTLPSSSSGGVLPALDLFNFDATAEQKPTSSDDEEVEIREPITLNVTTFGIEGDLVLSFSETLFSLDELAHLGLNITVLNELKDRILNISYRSNALDLEVEEGDKIVIPEMSEWSITNFTRYDLRLKFEFLNPLYVSTYDGKDRMTIRFLNPHLFIAKKDNLTMEVGYALSRIKVPQQAGSKADGEAI